MARRALRRAEAITAMADHVLAQGLAGASLRTLAAAAGTSDRMLLYYFTSKDDLLAATLGDIAQRLLTALEQALPADTRLPANALLARLRGALATTDLRAAMAVWLELVAGALRGQQPHTRLAGPIAAGFHQWIAARLDAPEAERAAQAARLLALVDGMLLLDAAGTPELAALAAI